MSIRGIVILTAWLSLAIGIPQLTAQSLQPIVDAHYPTSRLPVDTEDEKGSCYVVTDSGTPTIVAAAYTNGTEAMIRILSGSGTTFAVVAETATSELILASQCRLVLLDITGEGTPELLFGIDGPQGWVFTLNGTTLTNLTPTTEQAGRFMTELYNPSLCDLLHDGTVQVCTFPGTSDGREPSRVYRSVGGVMTVERSALAVARFQADWVEDAKTASFPLLVDSVGPFSIQTVNGDASGQHRVTTGNVFINESNVTGPAQLNDVTEFSEAPLSTVPVASNELRVELTGPAGSYIFVVVRDSTVR